MKQILFFVSLCLLSSFGFSQIDDLNPQINELYDDVTLLSDVAIPQVFDFPANVPIKEEGCIFSNDSFSILSGFEGKVYFAGCRNAEYCESMGLSGSGKWICSPAGAGQTSKCFQCK